LLSESVSTSLAQNETSEDQQRWSNDSGVILNNQVTNPLPLDHNQPPKTPAVDTCAGIFILVFQFLMISSCLTEKFV